MQENQDFVSLLLIRNCSDQKNNIFKSWKLRKLKASQPKILSKKIYNIYEWRQNKDIFRVKESVTSRTALQEILKVVLHAEGKWNQVFEQLFKCLLAVEFALLWIDSSCCLH